MAIGGINGYRPVLRASEPPRKSILGDGGKETSSGAEIQDKVDISTESMEKFRESIGQETEESAELTLNSDEIPILEEKTSTAEVLQIEGISNEDEEEETESEKVGGSVGINAQKLARMLAAAKTRAQVRSVIALIQADLKECDSGKAQGLDVDEASVKAAEHLLQQAKSQMSSAEDREATPEEELASAIASLM